MFLIESVCIDLIFLCSLDLAKDDRSLNHLVDFQRVLRTHLSMLKMFVSCGVMHALFICLFLFFYSFRAALRFHIVVLKVL